MKIVTMRQAKRNAIRGTNIDVDIAVVLAVPDGSNTLSSLAAVVRKPNITAGTTGTKIHHPERLVSCKRRTDTEIVGMKSPSPYTMPIRPISLPIAISIASTRNPTTKYAEENHQNSARVERPENCAYLLRGRTAHAIGVFSLAINCTPYYSAKTIGSAD